MGPHKKTRVDLTRRNDKERGTRDSVRKEVLKGVQAYKNIVDMQKLLKAARYHKVP